MPAAPLDPPTGPDVAPVPVGSRPWITIGAGLLLFVLVPFALLGTWFEAVATETVHASSPRWLIAAAIVTLLTLDIVLPVPSSVVSTAAGAALGFWSGLAASTLGMTACCQIGYAIGRTSGRAVAARFVGEPALADVERWVRDRGDWILCVMRPVPVLAEASVLLAGIAHLGGARFTAMTFLANLGVSAAYALAGATASSTGSMLPAIAGAIVLPALVMGVARLARRRLRGRCEPTQA
jgi:uncharacterized membrane protein YdjX (TVP38/TMEM64 family)